MKGKSLPIITFEHERDAYGFAEEEEERSERWKDFLERQAESALVSSHDPSTEEGGNASSMEEARVTGDDSDRSELDKSNGLEETGPGKRTMEKKTRTQKIQIFAQIRPSLAAIEQMMSLRVKNRKNLTGREQYAERSGTHLAPMEEREPAEDSEDEFYDVERSDLSQEALPSDGGNADSAANLAGAGTSLEHFSPWKEELECLVRGGLPMALRGELWQAFVGVEARRVEGYYNSLLDLEARTYEDKELDATPLDNKEKQYVNWGNALENWKRQIEKDLPRTFPGHPALGEDGRNALRRVLTAYARHNPSVGYCQAMNFFAGLLLLLMPEENAFWTLTGIIDDYFDGYYSEEMIEFQVDQLVLEELVRERFPKLVKHLDYLGVQVAWVTGPWFLSIFVNMLPWESGPALVTTKDAGDAVTLLQSLVGSTFDSSQLVLTACMGYQAMDEIKLQQLRDKHCPSVIGAMEERSRGLRVWKDSKGLATKLYGFKRDPDLTICLSVLTLTGIIDDYFDGYYSEEMIEFQVDQLVLEELVRERFPKLVKHLDYLGVQVAWVTGPWFLSIFVNMLPWESGPALVTTKDAGDAVTLLQSLVGSTFDSSQLVLTACMGYQAMDEIKLQQLRDKHCPSVIGAMEERSRGLRVWKDSKGLATKLYGFKRDPVALVSEANSTERLGNTNRNGDLHLDSESTDLDYILGNLRVDAELDSLPDIKEQVVWLKAELCRLLEEKRAAILRAEELETALMEMVKQDNRRLMSAKVEQLEQEVSELRQALSDKQEQEHAMLQVLMRVEQEQKVTEDARIFAEQDAAAQRYAAHVLEEKYGEAMTLLAQMEKRAVMAETMLEATLQNESSQLNVQQPSIPSPRYLS
ncbi:hypothetical protein COCNU_12G007090 [Cocos nucifera]|uniref:Rab-GAP TBC domain-containing protein n=1 Tax=Cocos nucifera TaxID=13894 RepID=A0A8K0IRQ7_COCNU|nr:hypothetical protein COCNU_12G007090 [Cocos nucifera]